jgi:hypothetical protein
MSGLTGVATGVDVLNARERKKTGSGGTPILDMVYTALFLPLIDESLNGVVMVPKPGRIQVGLRTREKIE